MGWTVANHTVTDTGLTFEFHGDRTDPQGRPLQVALWAVPFDTTPDKPEPDPDAQTVQAAMQKAAAAVLKSVGDGTAVPAQPTLGARVKAFFTGNAA